MEVLRQINVQGHLLDIYGSIEEPLFLAGDVAKMIDYSAGNTGQMLDIVDPNEKLTLTIERSGQRREMWFLREYGLYEVLMQSRKPIARRFKSAIKEILRDLRLSGKEDFEDWLNHSDPLVDEWEAKYQDEMTFADFLRTKGFTDEMLDNE